MTMTCVPKVLTFAGSDPSGGAGIQADLKVMTQLGVYGAAAVAALTRQTSQGVVSVMPLPADWVIAQVEEVLWDIQPSVMKTGMLQNADVIREIGRLWRKYIQEDIQRDACRNIQGSHNLALVVDPVLHSGTGVSLLASGGLDAFWQELLPVTTVVTPNVPEAEAFSGMEIRNTEDMEQAARCILNSGVRWVLLKGGHLPGCDEDQIVDLLCGQDQILWFRGQRVPKADLHGTGCTLASAVASFLALGFSVVEGVERAVQWVRWGIANPLFVGQGRGVVCQRELGVKFG